MKAVILVLCVLVGLLPCNGQECVDQIVCQRLRQVAEDTCAEQDVGGVASGSVGENGDIEMNTLMISDNESMAMIEELNESIAMLKEECTAERTRLLGQISAMIVKENAMIATIENLNETIARLKDGNKKMEQEFCKVYYNRKCFWFIGPIPVSQYITYEQGEALCSKTPGGQTAILYDDEHYHRIQEHIRSFMTSGLVYSFAWLGLKVNPANKQALTLREEMEPPFMKWYPGYPILGSANTNVVLQVNKRPDPSGEGMTNHPPTYTNMGVLCEA